MPTLRDELQRVFPFSSAQVLRKIDDEYIENPNHALGFCLQEFGSKEYQNALRIYIHRNIARTAFILAAKRCMERYSLKEVA